MSAVQQENINSNSKKRICCGRTRLKPPLSRRRGLGRIDFCEANHPLSEEAWRARAAGGEVCVELLIVAVPTIDAHACRHGRETDIYRQAGRQARRHTDRYTQTHTDRHTGTQRDTDGQNMQIDNNKEKRM